MMISIAEALKELKNIDSKIERRIAEITRYCSKMRASKDEIENQDKHVEDMRKSVLDLANNYRLIKVAIQKSNLENKAEYGGNTYTIAELIMLKQGILKYYSNLYDAFSPSNAQRQINESVRRNVPIDKESLEAFNIVPQLYYDSERVRKEKEYWFEFGLKIDMLIDKNNHTAQISV